MVQHRAPKSGAAVAARLLRRNRPTEAVPARPSGRNRPVDLQEPLGRPAGTGCRSGGSCLINSANTGSRLDPHCLKYAMGTLPSPAPINFRVQHLSHASRCADGKPRICLHHSSVPYSP